MTKSAKPISHHEALIYAMVTLSAADRAMTDQELRMIGEIVQRMPVFQDFDAELLVPTAEACGALLQDENGLDTVLAVIASALPEKLHETAYALAIEVAAADLYVEQEELRFLQILRDELDVSDLAVAAIEHSARVRYRTL